MNTDTHTHGHAQTRTCTNNYGHTDTSSHVHTHTYFKQEIFSKCIQNIVVTHSQRTLLCTYGPHLRRSEYEKADGLTQHNACMHNTQDTPCSKEHKSCSHIHTYTHPFIHAHACTRTPTLSAKQHTHTLIRTNIRT